MVFAFLLTDPWWTLAIVSIGYLALMPYSIVRYARIRRQRAYPVAPSGDASPT